MELIGGMIGDDGMIFGPTINELSSNIILRWDMSLAVGNNISIELYDYSGSHPLDVTIDWGDGNTEYVNVQSDYSHTYASSGIYDVVISGNAVEYLAPVVNRNALTDVISWGDLHLQQIIFQCENLTNVATNFPSTMENVWAAFEYCINLNDANMSAWTMSNVANMHRAFQDCHSFNQPIDSWDVGNVTDMRFCFKNNYSFNQSLNSWDVGNVNDMTQMFYTANSFNSNIVSWNTSNVFYMQEMFRGATVFNQEIGNWNVSNVTDMGSMFQEAYAFNSNISAWDVANVGYGGMAYMFANATVFNQNLSGWCVTNILTEPPDFSTGSALTSGNKPVWGTCPP